MQNSDQLRAGEECRSKSGLAHTGFDFSIRHLSFVILLTILAALFTTSSFAQSSNRWLFVFETSSSMRNRTKGIEAVTRDLLTSGMHGQIRPGDTIGIWTFSDKLHTGEAPLQSWSPEAGPTIVQHTLQFLSSQTYAKSGHLIGVVSNILKIVQASDIITVFLFSDADERISGTPFDATINEFYKANYRQQKKAAMPVITVLRGERGYITTNTLNLAPWPVDIPVVPFRQAAKKVAPKPAVKAPKPKPPPPVPPLIYDGRKSETSPPVAPAPPGAANNAPAKPVEVSSVAAPTPIAVAKVEATPPSAATVQPPAPITPAPAVVTPESPPAVVATPSSPAPLTAAKPANVPASSQPSSNSLASSVPASTPPAKSEPPSQPKATTVASTPRPATEAAASVLQPNLFSARNIAILSAAFAVIVCGLLILSARRARSHASLITRSLDRERR